MVISSYSLSKSPLAAGDSFTLTITAKNNMGVKAIEIDLSGRVEYEYYDERYEESLVKSHAVFERIMGQAVSWANNASKTFTFKLNVYEDMWEILEAMKEESGGYLTNVRSSSIEWTLTAHSAGTEDNFAGEEDSASFTTGVLLDWRYAPKVDVFALERIMDGVPNDEGVNLMADMKLSADERAQTELFTLKLHYAEGVKATASSPSIDLTAHIPDLLAGVTDSATLISETFANNSNWNFLLVFGDTYESVQARTTVPRAFANLHLSGASTGGAAFGGFSTSTEDNPLLECHYPAKFYAGIDGVTDYTRGEGNLNTTYFSAGTVYWVKYGRLVMIHALDITPIESKLSSTFTAYVIATGVPAPAIQFSAVPIVIDTDNCARAGVTSDGELRFHQRSKKLSDISGTQTFSVTFCYISKN